MKKCKRLSALLLALCLILSLAVPAVWAEEAETVTYSFASSDYKNKAFDAITDDMASKFAAGTATWKYEGSSMEQNMIKYTGSANIQVNAYEADEWIAFRIKAPAAGQYKVTANYAYRNMGGKAAMYILPAGDAKFSAASITGTPVIEEVNFHSEDTSMKIDGVVTSSDNWTCDGSSKEYIVAFKVTEKCGHGGAGTHDAPNMAIMYLQGIKFEYAGAYVPPQTVTYSFASSDYKNKAFDAITDDMAAKFAAGAASWKYEGSSMEESKIKYTGNANIQVNAYEADEWIAFRIKAPAVGQYKVTANYGYRNMGGKAAMYILPAPSGDAKFSAADITGTPVIEEVNFHSEDTGLKVDGVVTSSGNWTCDSGKDYIVVFKITEKSGHGGTGTHDAPNMAIMYLQGIKLEYAGAYMPPVKEVTYNFDLMNQGLEGISRNGLYDEKCLTQIKTCFEKGTLNWKYRDISFTTERATDVTFDKASGSFRGRAEASDWIAFIIKSPGKGEVELSLKHHATAYGTPKLNVYLLPLGTTNVGASMSEDYLLGTVNLYDPEQPLESPAPAELKETSLGKVTLGDEGGYILAFKAMEENAGGKSHIYFSQLTAKGATTDVEYVEPQEPEVPEEDVLEQIAAEVAAKNAIGSYTVRVMATDVVNGHDYVYVAMMGKAFYAYDLDAGKLVGSWDNCQSTPRCIYVDENHIVWIGGSNGKLNRYDPVANTCEEITIPNITDLFPGITSFNCWGLTGDGNGNLYFATYNTSYMAKYDTKTGTFSRISAHLSEDAQYAGTGGVILKDGYAYLTIDGNKNGDSVTSHELIKFDLQKQEIAERLKLAENLGGQQYLTFMYLVGDVILGSTSAVLDANVAVDISGEQMKLIDIPGLTGIKGGVSEVIDGKAYFLDFNSQLQAYDVEKRTVTPAGIETSIPVKATGGGIVTIEGDDRLPGLSIVTFQSKANELNLLLYNPQTKANVTINNITDYQGTGNQLRSLEISPDGKTIYIGAYGINQISVFDVESGKVIKQFGTVGHQAEGLIWYEGLLYGGHYGTDSTGISVIDVEAATAKLLVTLDNSVFMQHRMHANTAGDGMVFYGTAPIKNVLGGVLCWFDQEENRVYVAAGPNKEDVYYTEAGNTTGTGWYSVVTGQLADFDDNNDGKDDAYIGEAQRFTGLIKNQSVNCIIYKDGYIYGSTTRAGGSGAVYVDNNSAQLFVYDVEAKKVIGTCDIGAAIEGLTTPADFIDVIAMDPEVEGKFWGVVSDTLFSYTVDLETGKFTVTEELSYGKKNYNHGKNEWQSRDIIFDGDFMYVVFGSKGVYMVNRDDASVNYRISHEIPKRMVLAADDNLYFINNENDLKVLKIAETAQGVKDPYEVADVQAMIDALKDAASITLEDEAAVLAARKAYNALSEAGKAQVKADKLTAAEAVIVPLRAAADKAAADAVIAQIAAIGTVTLESEDAILASRAAYEALTDSQKAMVTNLNVLTAAESTLAALKEAQENPKTGDMMQVAAFAGILLTAAAAMSVALVSDIRRKHV